MHSDVRQVRLQDKNIQLTTVDKTQKHIQYFMPEKENNILLIIQHLYNNDKPSVCGCVL